MARGHTLVASQLNGCLQEQPRQSHGFGVVGLAVVLSFSSEGGACSFVWGFCLFICGLLICCCLVLLLFFVVVVCYFVGLLFVAQRPSNTRSAFQEQICKVNCSCRHTEIEVAKHFAVSPSHSALTSGQQV